MKMKKKIGDSGQNFKESVAKVHWKHVAVLWTVQALNALANRALDVAANWAASLIVVHCVDDVVTVYAKLAENFPPTQWTGCASFAISKCEFFRALSLSHCPFLSLSISTSISLFCPFLSVTIKILMSNLFLCSIFLKITYISV